MIDSLGFNYLNAAEQLMCENEDKNVTEVSMINVIYLARLTVITAALTFLPSAHESLQAIRD